ncbi:MAG: DUF2218 domain-containing protein [Streptomyces sp.]|nr:DUF2218 domain-containing protein [Streptomyces sp.]
MTLPWGRCTLDAASDALVLRAEGDDEQGQRQLQGLLATHLGRFGRRATASTSARRRHLTWAGITVLGILAPAPSWPPYS